MAQELPFTEVIVVDNNSTDNSTAIARSFPGVRVLTEVKQGVVHARSTGFDAAQGYIIARIDADTRLPADWTKKLYALFEATDVQAVTGPIYYYDMAASKLEAVFERHIRAWLGYKLRHKGFLLGSNMAIRREAWQVVRPQLHKNRELHEDIELALHIAEAGGTVSYSPTLLTGVSGRRVDTNFFDFYRYVRAMPQTYVAHGANEAKYLYLVGIFVIINYPLLRLLYRGYDADLRSYRFSKLFESTIHRANPATFVE